MLQASACNVQPQMSYLGRTYYRHVFRRAFKSKSEQLVLMGNRSPLGLRTRGCLSDQALGLARKGGMSPSRSNPPDALLCLSGVLGGY